MHNTYTYAGRRGRGAYLVIYNSLQGTHTHDIILARRPHPSPSSVSGLSLHVQYLCRVDLVVIVHVRPIIIPQARSGQHEPRCWQQRANHFSNPGPNRSCTGIINNNTSCSSRTRRHVSAQGDGDPQGIFVRARASRAGGEIICAFGGPKALKCFGGPKLACEVHVGFTARHHMWINQLQQWAPALET